ncbi:MAG: TetR/AcrR family transcriptional regulator [Proteobacteria bacterium]|nr:TetR/AcrR family transcriptional regulator [Pseudomonadota bacterium]
MTQISDIIKRARIARGTVYQYFKNKDDIFITLLDNYFTTWRNGLAKRDSELDFSKITAVDFLKQRIKTTLQFFADDHELCNIVLKMGVGLHDNIEKVIQRLEGDIQTIIKEELYLGQRTRNISEDMDTDLVANLLTGAVLRTALYYFVQEREAFKDKTVDELAEGITRVFAPGLFQKVPSEEQETNDPS